jgi:hypothetical protein
MLHKCVVLIIFLHATFVAIEKEIEPVDESMIGWNMQSCCHFIRKRWW